MFFIACSKHVAEHKLLQETTFSPSLEVKSFNKVDFLHHEQRRTFCHEFSGGEVYVTYTSDVDAPICKEHTLLF